MERETESAQNEENRLRTYVYNVSCCFGMLARSLAIFGSREEEEEEEWVFLASSSSSSDFLLVKSRVRSVTFSSSQAHI